MHLFSKVVQVYLNRTMLIERFSEDIDLILDWRKIINAEVNPWEERSKTKQDLFNKQINSEAAKFYKEELIPQLQLIWQ